MAYLLDTNVLVRLANSADAQHAAAAARGARTASAR